MGSALPHHDPFNLRPTNRTWLPGALVNPEIILEFPAAVHPIDTRSIPPDAFFEHLPDRGQQPICLTCRNVLPRG